MVWQLPSIRTEIACISKQNAKPFSKTQAGLTEESSPNFAKQDIVILHFTNYHALYCKLLSLKQVFHLTTFLEKQGNISNFLSAKENVASKML